MVGNSKYISEILGNYQDAYTRVVDRIRFEYEGEKYSGRGCLAWLPESGFTLRGVCRRSDPSKPLNLRISVGRSVQKVIRARLRFQHGNHGILAIRELNPFTLAEGWLEAQANSLIEFTSRYHRLDLPDESEHWKDVFVPQLVGEGSYGSPFSVQGGERVETNVFQQRSNGPLQRLRQMTWGGFSYEDGRLSVTGEFRETSFHVSWSFPEHSDLHLNQKVAWDLGGAIPAAVGLLVGAYFPIRSHESSHGTVNRAITYKSIAARSTDLALHPTPHRCRGKQIAPFALFLCQDNPVAQVLKRFYLESSIARTTAERSLFVGKSIESAARTIRLWPLRNNVSKLRAANKKLKLDLNDFCVQELNFDEEESNSIMDAFRKLRHAEAHCHWVCAYGSESASELTERIRLERVATRFFTKLISIHCPEALS